MRKWVSTIALGYWGAGARRAQAGKGGWGIISDGDAEDLDLVNRVSTSYDDAQAKALHRLSQPIPIPPNDETNPDFVIGFVEYKFRERDAYRVAISKALRLAQGPSAVKLSIAWHGRLPQQFMRGLQKAVGVSIPDTALPVDHRQDAIDGIIADINDRKQLSLMELSIVKALDGRFARRSTNLGEVGSSAKDVIKVLTQHRAAVVLCKAAELEWVSANAVRYGLAARVDVEVVVLDGEETPLIKNAAVALRAFVEACAAKNRRVAAFDGSPIASATPSLSDLVVTPALCVNGNVVAVGTFGVTKAMSRKVRLHALVYHPHAITAQGRRVS